MDIKSLEALEQENITLLRGQLADHFALLESARDLLMQEVYLALDSAKHDQQDPLPLDLQVAVQIVTRIANDCRSVTLLAEKGYVLQSMGLVATIFEMCIVGLDLFGNAPKAEQWLKHTDPYQWNDKGPKDLTKQVLQKLGFSDADVEKEWGYYKWLCVGKHGNPVLQRQYGRSVTLYGKQQFGNYVEAGPQVTDEAIEELWFTLGMLFRAVGRVLTSFSNPYLHRALSDVDYTKTACDLGDEVRAFHDKAAAVHQAMAGRYAKS